jgi:hypothetical protein
MKCWLVATACMWLGASAADATLITQTFDLSTTEFVTSYPFATVPFKTITGQFSITFDNSSDVDATTDGLSVTGFSASSAYSLKYAYDKATDSFTVATLPDKYLCYVNSQYFCFFVPNASSDLSPDGVTTNNIHYSYPGQLGAQPYYNATRTITRISGAVPEPATWLTFIVGFGLIGAAIRRRQEVIIGLA